MTSAKKKLSSALARKMREHPPQEPLPIIVKYRTTVVSAQAVVPGVEPKRRYRLMPAAALQARPQDIETLSQHESVEKIWLDLPVHICLAESVPLIGVPPLWENDLRGQGMKIAIIDTGIDPQHPDFSGRIAAGVSFVSESYVDDNGHGTHVAGIAAGSGAASGGRYRGVAPEATLYIAKVLQADGSGLMSDVMAGVEWAVEQQVHVIGLSLTGPHPCDGTDPLSETCDAAVEAGVVVCAAAGNAGPGESTIGSPGCARLVLTIGATDKNDQVADFSSRGPTADGRIKPNICFPGVDIVSCRAAGTSMGTPVDEYYTQASGTSMATPHAVGAVALLLQAQPDWTPAQVKARLTGAAVDLGLDANTQGAGRANVFAAWPGPPPPPPEPPEPPPPTPTPPPPTPEPPGCWEAIRRVFRVT